MSDSVNIVLQEQFVVTDIDKEGKKFDKVSRLTSFCQSKTMEVTLDYASELINFAKADRIVICLARSLQLDPTSLMTDGGAKEGKREMWRGGEQGLAQEYDYVMYGKSGRRRGRHLELRKEQVSPVKFLPNADAVSRDATSSLSSKGNNAPDACLADPYQARLARAQLERLHGPFKIYKFDDSRKGDNQTTAYLSFGGLLMAIRGSYRHMSNLVINENIYLLIKK
ncbi:hypothetical protein QFC21_005544 [Naganishia friedmannii]|uniref:Uncharacterized protein n=1 Tax=Naganishia friedmannii TaxID=89922 RepID=A0ACC2VAT3_9TREE|nr:hypothetical protein QFC21_005544 [Naganishia friedmannii]